MNPNNPYRKVLRLLEAVPSDKRFLLAKKRRGRVVGVRGACGCLFGTIAPPRVRNPRSEYAYTSDMNQSTAFRDWADQFFGEDAARYVRELEFENDHYFSPGTDMNQPLTAAARYRYMCDYVRRGADDWDRQYENRVNADE